MQTLRQSFLSRIDTTQPSVTLNALNFMLAYFFGDTTYLYLANTETSMEINMLHAILEQINFGDYNLSRTVSLSNTSPRKYF